MARVKGAVLGLLDASFGRGDEVCLIVVRGAEARVRLEPTRDLEEVRRTLEHVPTGGRTPLASGLEHAARYASSGSVLVVVTDGRANVPTRGADAWADALAAARALRGPALVVDSAGDDAERPARQLAQALGAGHVRLEDLGAADLQRLVTST
jgi:magnesium chelatase subunit D